MKILFKKLFSDKQQTKLSVTIAVIVVFCGIALYITFSELGVHWPSDRKIEEKKQELKQQQRKLKKAQEQARALREKELVFDRLSKKFWTENKKSHIDTDMRSKIEQCAKNAEFELRSMGNIRRSKIANGLNKMEISISAKSPMDKVVHFLNNIRQAEPAFFWQQCSLRPVNMKNPGEVHIDGTLAVISINRTELEKFLKKEKK